MSGRGTCFCVNSDCSCTMLFRTFWVWGAGPMIVQIKESRQGARTPYAWAAILQVGLGRHQMCTTEEDRPRLFWFRSAAIRYRSILAALFVGVCAPVLFTFGHSSTLTVPRAARAPPR